MTVYGLGGKLYRRARQFTRLPAEALKELRPSFSQYGEDQALRSILRPQANGTFVDVGANDPLGGSNTAFLYSLGWSGLAIEPNPQFAARYKKARPRDTFLNMGVAAEAGVLTYYQFETPEINTFSKDRAKQLVEEGHSIEREQQVRCGPLNEIVRAHLSGRHVDVLSVDCEGLDLDVLRSAKLSEMQPTVLIVEDFDRYFGFRDGQGRSEVDEFLRAADYVPICQLVWSSIYVARNWRAHPRGAFLFPEEAGYLP